MTATDPQLATDLQFMREEERLARDLYLLFAERYPDANVFANITRSEDRHYTAVGRQLENFGIDDPSAGLEAGDYGYAELDELYATLAKQGETLDGAIKAGIAVEEEDIADLEAALARESSDPVERTFAALLAGSQNHLDAFTTALENGGVCDCTGDGNQNRQGANDRQGNGNRQGPGNGQGAGAGAGMRQGNATGGAGAQDHPARRLLRGCHPRWRTTEADLARFAAWWSPQDLPGQQVQVALGDMGMSSMMGGTAPSDARMMLRAWPTSVPAGQVSLVVANMGWRTGEVSASCGADAGEGITSGSAGWTTLTLPPGRYELVCNLPNHYAAGMYQELTVTS